LSSEPQLRPVPPLGEAADAGKAPPLRPARFMLPLAVALAIALALLGWNRAQVAGQVADLEDAVRTLEAEVAERDRVIGAHQSRLNDARAHAEGLLELLSKPLPEAN
jgi:hypothetical protein